MTNGEAKGLEGPLGEGEVREEPEAKRPRNLGELRATVHPATGVYLVLEDVPAFATVEEYNKWVREAALPGVPYAWIRVGPATLFAVERRQVK